ncbi:unnamed protein product [Microthlaspi erraticum]|uniref:Uncharacterized protein n=1 Tax=Microthlaspi erraticum TaxID=1685480 RepID=A0A6D2KS62_9BRAS|nr:unnamed protein product [Microthlaspi erraticum]
MSFLVSNYKSLYKSPKNHQIDRVQSPELISSNCVCPWWFLRIVSKRFKKGACSKYVMLFFHTILFSCGDETHSSRTCFDRPVKRLSLHRDKVEVLSKSDGDKSDGDKSNGDDSDYDDKRHPFSRDGSSISDYLLKASKVEDPNEKFVALGTKQDIAIWENTEVIVFVIK